jgi:RND superfamily putative drug exporter
MKFPLSPTNLARAGARHPWRTIGAWLVVLAVAIALVVTLLGDALVTDYSLTNNPESVQGNDLIAERLGEDNTTIGEIVVVRSESLTVAEPAYRAYVETLYADLVSLGDELIAGGTHYYLTGDESLVSADRRTTLIPLTIREDAKDEIERVHRVVDEADESSAFDVLVTGAATLDAEVIEVAERDLTIGEGIGLSVALVVLALVFGAIAASVLPLVMAILAIVVALGATALVGQVWDLPFFVVNMMTMMGLAVGIDYSLFIVSRYREERTTGRAKLEAIAATGAAAGRTVLLSGLTVVLALFGLLITPDSANQSIGIGVLLVVVAAVLASLTLLPALLSLMGDKVDALRIPFLQRRRSGSSVATDRGFWGWTSRVVMRRPVLSLALAGGALLVAASWYAEIDQGEIGVSALPDGLMSKDAFVVLEEEFGFGQDLPAVVVIDGQTDLASVQAAVARLEAAVAADPAFAATELAVHPEANLTILRAWLTGDPAGTQAMDAIERLRADHVAAAFAGVPARALVTGRTAELFDLAEVNETYQPIVFVVVLALSFVLLTVAFRSIVIPIKAILLNLLSVGATYGLLVLVFQKGVGTELFGFQQVEVIQTGLPIFLFAVLFGLSMDYHVFLLSRIRERYLETGDNGEAVAYGLRATGRLITGAALIMVAVFGGFALGDLVAMQQFGFGLAVAVLLDATIVRAILVPAGMRLLGKWNWYLPTFLRWLPELRVEAATPVERTAWGD